MLDEDFAVGVVGTQPRELLNLPDPFLLIEGVVMGKLMGTRAVGKGRQ